MYIKNILHNIVRRVQAMPSAELESLSEPSETERITAVRVETTRRITALGCSGRPREVNSAVEQLEVLFGAFTILN